MKNKLKELDVDIIGGQAPLTKSEELAISTFIKAGKKKSRLRVVRKTKEAVNKKEHQLI